MSNENGLVSRDDFLKKKTRRFKVVTLTDGTNCRIQSLTEGEKANYEASVLTTRGQLNRGKFQQATRRLIVLVLVDAAGNRILAETDLPAIANMDGAIIAQIYTAAREHCGFEEGDIEGLVKNSEAVPAGDSPSD